MPSRLQFPKQKKTSQMAIFNLVWWRSFFSIFPPEMSSLIDHPDLMDVQRELCSGNKPIIFFIGAGLSKELGYPLWHEMLQEMVHYAAKTGRMTSEEMRETEAYIERCDYLMCGNLLRDRLGPRIEEQLRERFSQETLPQRLGSYEGLVQLPCAGFVTTNYDAALENAYSKVHKKSLIPVLPEDKAALGGIAQNTPFLFKLHGDVARRRFVLSLSDYENLLQDAALQRFLYSLFFYYKIVFLGYGLSDNDISIPLKQITRDFHSGGRRHVAVLPEGKNSKSQLDFLEKQVGINTVCYPYDDSHRAVHSIIINWVLAAEESNSRRFVLNSSQDCTELLRHDEAIILPYLRNTAVRLHDWLVQLPYHWGPAPESEPRTANIAEGLLAMSAAARVLGKAFPQSDLLAQLLNFFDETGSFISKSLGTAQVQTHSLATFALSQCTSGSQEHRAVLGKAVDWLFKSMSLDKLGWGRFSRSGTSRTIPSCWAFAALLHHQRFPNETWNAFAEMLLRSQALDYIVGEKGRSSTAAGWLLWFLAQLKSTGCWQAQEKELRNLAFNQLVGPKMLYLDEIESFQIDGDADAARLGIWVSWTHASAPAIILGCLPWLDDIPEQAWFALGKAIATLMQQASEGGDGHLKDSTLEREGTSPVVFHSLYGLWALSECIEVIARRLQS